jgi:hypothetical protein
VNAGQRIGLEPGQDFTHGTPKRIGVVRRYCMTLQGKLEIDGRLGREELG